MSTTAERAARRAQRDGGGEDQDDREEDGRLDDADGEVDREED